MSNWESDLASVIRWMIILGGISLGVLIAVYIIVFIFEIAAVVFMLILAICLVAILFEAS